MIKKLSFTFISIFFTLLVLELVSRTKHLSETVSTKANLNLIINEILASNFLDKELENRYSFFNYLKMRELKGKKQIEQVYLGTSRSKFIQPFLFQDAKTFIAAGNSYREIPYSYLIDVAVAKSFFPNLKTVFVETSLLNRLPPAPSFQVESHHKKYLPILKTLLPLFESKSYFKELKKFLEDKTLGKVDYSHLNLFKNRNNYKLSSLFFKNTNTSQLLKETNLYKKLNADGSQNNNLRPYTKKESDTPEITQAHPKIQRLANHPINYPWDDQFDLLVDWAKLNKIQIIFFQPPVRSDFLKLQQLYFLDEHTKNIETLSKKNNILFIDLNENKLGFSKDWSLFGDEDHISSTQKGNIVLQTALKLGLKRYNSKHKSVQKINKDETVQFLKENYPNIYTDFKTLFD